MGIENRAKVRVREYGGVVTAGLVKTLLHAAGEPVLGVEFVGSDWPHMVTFVARMPLGDRCGIVSFEAAWMPDAIEQVATVSLVEERHDDSGKP